MNEQSYLTFSLNNQLYGISTVYVEEMFSLPELTPLAEAPQNIIGVINFRGKTLPIMTLTFSPDAQSPDYRLTDSVVVLRWEERRVGILVNEVHELKNISPKEITAEFYSDQELAVGEKKIIADITGFAGDVFILGNIDDLLQNINMDQTTSFDYSLENEIKASSNVGISQANGSELSLEKQPGLDSDSTLEARVIFQQQTDSLNFSEENHNSKNLKPLAVVVLNGNFMGIDLAMVREFTDIRKVTPIPCCPTHIIGNMNLRGEVLTLVDIRGLLNLPLMNLSNTSKAMVVEVEGIVAGVLVEEVSDAMFFLNPVQITAAQTAIHAINDEYLQGVAPYDEKIMSILDLPKVLLKGKLIVDEI